MRAQTFGLEKDLMRVLVGKSVDLVLDARAVARPYALDHTGEHRAAVESRTDDRVGALIGVGDPAGHLARVLAGMAHEAEDRQRVEVAGLLGQLREVDRPAVDARRRAGLQATLRQLELLEPRRQGHRRRITGPPGGMVAQAHMNAAVEEGARRQHHGTGAECDAHLRDRTHHPVDPAVRLDQQVVHRLLEQPQIGLVLQPMADRRLVQDPVGLGSCGPHCRPLAAVEDAELNARLVGGRGHGAAQRVDLLDQMALADAPDRGVAAHLPQRLDVVAQQQGAATHAGRSQCRLGASMATADDDHIECLGMQHGVGGVGRRQNGVNRSPL